MPSPPPDPKMLVSQLLPLLERVLDSICLSPGLRTQIVQQARYELFFLVWGSADETEE